MRPTFDQILSSVMSWYGVTWTELIGYTRQPRVVRARRALAALAWECCEMSYPEIAAALGKGSHSSFVQQAAKFRAVAAGHEAAVEVQP